MKNKFNKKGISHIEMIISFTLFFMFVVFLLFYLNPLKSQNIGEVLLDIVQQGVEDRSLVYLVEVPLINTTELNMPCFQIPITDFFVATDERNFSVKSSSGSNVPFNILQTGSEYNMSIQNLQSSLYYIYSANETLTETPQVTDTKCQILTDSQYTLANPTIHSIYSYTRLSNLKDDYDNDYNRIKAAFSFPVGSDFAINITDLSTKKSIIDMKKTKPKAAEIRAIQLPIEVWKDGDIRKAIMNVQVW